MTRYGIQRVADGLWFWLRTDPPTWSSQPEKARTWSTMTEASIVALEAQLDGVVVVPVAEDREAHA